MLRSVHCPQHSHPSGMRRIGSLHGLLRTAARQFQTPLTLDADREVRYIPVGSVRHACSIAKSAAVKRLVHMQVVHRAGTCASGVRRASAAAVQNGSGDLLSVLLRGIDWEQKNQCCNTMGRVEYFADFQVRLLYKAQDAPSSHCRCCLCTPLVDSLLPLQAQVCTMVENLDASGTTFVKGQAVAKLCMMCACRYAPWRSCPWQAAPSRTRSCTPCCRRRGGTGRCLCLSAPPPWTASAAPCWAPDRGANARRFHYLVADLLFHTISLMIPLCITCREPYIGAHAGKSASSQQPRRGSGSRSGRRRSHRRSALSTASRGGSRRRWTPAGSSLVSLPRRTQPPQSHSRPPTGTGPLVRSPKMAQTGTTLVASGVLCQMQPCRQRSHRRQAMVQLPTQRPQRRRRQHCMRGALRTARLAPPDPPLRMCCRVGTATAKLAALAGPLQTKDPCLRRSCSGCETSRLG